MRSVFPIAALPALLLLQVRALAEPAERPRAGPSFERASAVVPLVSSTLARAAVRAALRAAGFPEASRRSERMVSRIGLSALLPDVSFRVMRSTDQSLRFSPTLDAPYRYSEAGGVGWWLEGRATWHLDRLLFDHAELSVERLRAGRAEAASHLVRRVLELLFEWQRARLDERDENQSDEARNAALLRASEAEVTLDVLTAGWFSASRHGRTEETSR